MTRARRFAVLAALVGLAPALVACGGDDAGGSAGDPPKVEVLEAGSGATQSFALDLEQGHRETATLMIGQSIDAAGQTIDSPPITLPLDIEVTDVSGDRITVEATYGEPSVSSSGGADPAVVAQVESALDSVAGLSSTSVLSPYGESLDSSIDIPEGADPMVRQLLEQFSDQAQSLAVPFPQEPLGEGARWTVTQHLELNGLEVEQVASYSLTSLGPDGSYDLDVSIEQTYEPGTVQGVEITGGSGSGSGTTSGTIGNLFPTSSELSFDNSVDAEAGGSSQTVRTHTSTTITSEVR